MTDTREGSAAPSGDGAGHYATAGILWVLAALGVAYGSLYPFEVTWEPVSVDEAVRQLLTGWQGELSSINILTNAVLFVPYGLFGAVALARWRRLPRWLVLYGTAAVLAFGLQVLQLWLPARVPTFADGIINMAGTLAGALIAWIPGVVGLMTQGRQQARQLLAIPLLLMLSWLAYRWFPFVPSLDVSSIKDSLRPLLLEPELRPLDAFHNLVGWLVFAFLWTQCRLRPGLLWAVIPVAVLAQAGIANNPLTLHNIIAGVAAPPAWYAIRRLAQRPVEPVTVLLIMLVIVQGLRPFELGGATFSWIPFQGFLSGSMFVNMLSLLEKVFLYGSLVWLTLEASQSRATGLILPLLLVTAVEAAQTQIAQRSPEITDALLCLLIWGVALAGWHPRVARPLRRPREPASPTVPIRE